MKILFFILFISLNANNCNEANIVNEETSTKTEQQEKTKRIGEYIEANNLQDYAQATFAGGCFWCVEAAFERINGVVDVVSGYSGGQTDNPSYKEVSYGKLEHAEAVEIFYDSEVIDYQTLLEVLFVAHDGTQLNRQGPDVGPQYRSAVFYKNENQKELTEAYIMHLEKEQGIDIVTQVQAYEEFWLAEEYHQNFYELNPNQGYVSTVTRPKVNKVLKSFPKLIKEKYKKK